MLRRFHALLLLLLSALTAAAGPPSGDDDVIWRDEEKKFAIFISETSLNADLAAAPLSAASRSLLALRLEWSRKQQKKADEEPCLWNLHASPGVPESDAPTLAQVLAGSHQALTVEVVRTVKGWSAWKDIPSTLVWARVIDVLQDESGTLRAGAVVAFETYQADITVAGTRICSVTGRTFHVPAAGDRLLMQAAPHAIADARYLAAIRTYPMSGTDVDSQPYANVAAFAKMPLSRLRTEAREIRARQAATEVQP